MNPIPIMPGSYLAAAIAAPHGEERAAVLREAWSWIHTPFLHENRVKGRGVDCGNYVAGVCANAGIIEAPPLYRYPHDFYEHSDKEIFRDIVVEFCDLIWRREVRAPLASIPAEMVRAGVEPATPLPGDIVSFAGGKLSVSHLAIVACWPAVVHSLRWPARAVVWDDNIGPLARAWTGTWRLKRWIP